MEHLKKCVRTQGFHTQTNVPINATDDLFLPISADTIGPKPYKIWIICAIMSYVCYAFTSVHCCLVVTCWERADLLAFICDV